MDTKITQKIWCDPDFLELENDEKLTYFWLLTNCDLVGFVEVTPRKLNRDFVFTSTVIDALIKGMPRALYVDGKGIWVRNYIGYQLNRGDKLKRNKVAISVARRVKLLPVGIANEVFVEYPELAELLEVSGESMEPLKPNSEQKKMPLPSTCHVVREREGEREGEGEGEAPVVLRGESDFDSWWSAYPRKIGRKACATKWKILAKAKELPSLEAMLATLKAQRSSKEWAKDGGEFIPHPATYLNQGRWSDVVAGAPNGHGAESTPLSLDEIAKQSGMRAL